MQFQDLLAPLDQEIFLNEVLGHDFRLLAGDEGRFGNLLPWADINDLLRYHRFLNHAQITVAREHKPAPLNKYNPQVQSFSFPGATAMHRQVNSEELSKYLRAGYSLQIKSMETLSEPIGRLVDSAEKVLRERVSVDAFISHGANPGFRPHWDGVHVIVAQVRGRKQWKIRHPDMNYPLLDGDGTSQPGWPAGEMKEIVLTSGDVLYLPRGWWHEVTPL